MGPHFVQTAIPDLAAELEKRFDSDSTLAILSCTNNIEEDFVEVIIRHIIPGGESSGYRVYYEYLYSLVHKDNSWEMALLELKSITI
jgi:hypothetical protein